MENNEPLGMFDELMSRGERLRFLRQLAIADEEARQNERKKKKHNKKKKQHTQHVDDENVNVITHESMNLVSEDTSTMLPPSLCSVTNLTDGGCSSNNSAIGDNNDDSSKGVGLKPHEEYDLGAFIEDDDDDDDDEEEDEMVDKIDMLPESKLRVLRYDSYLQHQRYNDDYKHADCHFIDFGHVQNDHSNGPKANDLGLHTGHRLVIEQQKSLGKGGIVWDAGYCLAEHLIANNSEWVTQCMKETELSSMPKMVELGAGTGLTGLMIAKAIRSHVYITDLPDLLRLIERNVERNFHSACIRKSHSFNLLTDDDLTKMDRGEAAQEVPTIRNLSTSNVTSLSDDDERILYNQYEVSERGDDVGVQLEDSKQAEGIVTAKVLRWGIKDDYKDGPFDVVFAGDVITSLYDPAALAQTIYDLCHEKSIVYVCLKKRLDKCQEDFEAAIDELFESVTFATPTTRHLNVKNISIMRATGRRAL